MKEFKAPDGIRTQSSEGQVKSEIPTTMQMTTHLVNMNIAADTERSIC